MNDTLIMDNEAEILQLHYHLKDESHSMDAFVFNKAESELLKTIEEISKIFGVQIIVETEALGEGGLRANYKFKSKQKSTLPKELKAILITVTSAVIGSYFTHKLTADPEMDKLNKEKTRLEILQIRNQLKKDSADIDQKNGRVQKDDNPKVLDTVTVDSIAQFITERNKIKMHRSNFYRAIKEDEKITKISAVALNDQHQPVSEEKVVHRVDFSEFIINDSRIDDLYEDNVYVEVIAPVLNGAGLKWKGLYKGNSITFSMQDQLFRDYIISKNLKFSNGVKLLCDLEIKRSMNKEGDIILGVKNVYNVKEMKYPEGDRVDILSK